MRNIVFITVSVGLIAAAQPPDDYAKAVTALQKNMPAEAVKLATKAIERAPSVPALTLRATAYEQLERYDDAVADYTKTIAIDKTLASVYQARGLVHFKAGKIKESIADFDKYIELKPDAKISHWQRGISYYYAGRFDDGRKQFEGYQDFDSNDVENAVWRFMCMARKDGIAKARKEILKIGDDKRVPMRQVYDLYKGDLKPADVFAAAKDGKPAPAQLSQRLFYAHLYVGIYEEILGNKKAAYEHMQKATESHRIGHYMWDVARIHRDLLAVELKIKK